MSLSSSTMSTAPLLDIGENEEVSGGLRLYQPPGGSSIAATLRKQTVAPATSGRHGRSLDCLSVPRSDCSGFESTDQGADHAERDSTETRNDHGSRNRHPSLRAVHRSIQARALGHRS